MMSVLGFTVDELADIKLVLDTHCIKDGKELLDVLNSDYKNVTDLRQYVKQLEHKLDKINKLSEMKR